MILRLKPNSSWLPRAIALGSGGLMGLTPAPVAAWPLAWVALAPLWVLVIQSDRPTSLRFSPQPLILAGLWGIGYHGLALSWITGIHPMDWMGVPWLASVAIAFCCWALITLWGASIPLIWAWGITWSLKHHLSSPLLRLLGGTALWCSLEWLWSISPLWWSSLSYTQSPHNLVILHLGQLAGPTAITAALVAVNGAIAETILAPQKRFYGAIALSLLLATHLLGGWLYLRPLGDRADTAFTVGLIQGNIPNTIKLYDEGWRRAIEGYTTGYNALAEQGVDIVLTPETALPTLWTAANRRYTSFYQAILEKGVPVWLGAFGSQGRDFTNSLFTIAGNGETLNEYRKAILVPLGEYIPFESILGGFINRLSPLDARLRPGTAHQQVDTPFGRAIAGICYESAFAHHFRRQAANGGQFIITASNNAHYSPAMPAQHHAQDVMRAIESDRWAARATNTGYSGIVDPHGRTIWQSGLNTYEIHQGTIHRRTSTTLYMRWGDWLTPLLILVAGAGLLLLRGMDDPP